MNTHRRGQTVAEVAGQRYGAQARALVVDATDEELADHVTLQERILGEVEIDRIEIKDRSALKSTWTRRFQDGSQHEYRCYQVDFGFTGPLLAFVAGDPFNGCFDPDFYVARGSSVTIRAANDEHRDELFEALERQIDRRNVELDEWEADAFPNIVAAMIREITRSRAAERTQRASDVAAGWK